MAKKHRNRGTEQATVFPQEVASLQLFLESYFSSLHTHHNLYNNIWHYCISYPLTSSKFHPWLSASHTSLRLSNQNRNNLWVSAAHDKNAPEITLENIRSQVRQYCQYKDYSTVIMICLYREIKWTHKRLSLRNTYITYK